MISRDIFLIFSVSMLNSHGFTNPKLFSPNLLLVLISSKKDLLSENERILKNAKSAKATNFFYQKAKINNSGFMKTRFKKAFHEQIKIY